MVRSAIPIAVFLSLFAAIYATEEVSDVDRDTFFVSFEPLEGNEEYIDFPRRFANGKIVPLEDGDMRGKRIEACEFEGEMVPMDAEKAWKFLEHAINEIYSQNTSGVSFEELYRNAYNMVLHKFGDKLYSGLTETMTHHLKEMCKTIEAAPGGLFLEELNRKWNNHINALQMIGDILIYMDRVYVPCQCTAPVHELGLNLWTEHILHNANIRGRLHNMLLDLINQERSGGVIDMGLMRNIIKMLASLGSSAYDGELEKPFLEVAERFSIDRPPRIGQPCSCGDGEYLDMAL